MAKSKYATSDEYQAAEVARKQDEQAYEDSRSQAVTWTAKSGQLVEVYVYGSDITVRVNNRDYDDCQFSRNVPDAARAAGIVAKLGPIGVTAEQKSQIEAKRQ